MLLQNCSGSQVTSIRREGGAGVEAGVAEKGGGGEGRLRLGEGGGQLGRPLEGLGLLLPGHGFEQRAHEDVDAGNEPVIELDHPHEVHQALDGRGAREILDGAHLLGQGGRTGGRDGVAEELEL